MDKNSKLGVALLLGVGSFFLLFLLGEGGESRSTLHTIIFIGGMGGYFLISGYFLSRGDPQAVPKGWSNILALNLVLIATTIVAWLVEPNEGDSLQMVGMAVLAVACSCVGAALAARAARSSVR